MSGNPFKGVGTGKNMPGSGPMSDPGNKSIPGSGNMAGDRLSRPSSGVTNPSSGVVATGPFKPSKTGQK